MSSAQSRNITDESGLDDLLSIVLRQSCRGGSTIADESLSGFFGLTFAIPTSSETGASSFDVYHEGRMYKNIRDQDLARAQLSKEVGRPVPKEFLQVAQAQNNKKNQGSKLALQELAEQEDWSEFRKQCAFLDQDIQENGELHLYLKKWAKRSLRTALEIGAVDHLRAKMARHGSDMVELFNKIGFPNVEGRRLELQVIYTDGFKRALCGWPKDNIAYPLTWAQGEVLGKIGQVDVGNTKLFRITERTGLDGRSVV